MSIKIYVKYVKNNRDFHTTKLNLPTGNLDSVTSHDVLGLLKMAAKQFSQTLILITHDRDIAQLADRIVHIEDGKIVGDTRKGSDSYA
jgi:putative ABC transport system ATP-binding protein